MFWNKFSTSIRDIIWPTASMVIGIDIGTTKVSAVVTRIENGNKKILGIGAVPFNGCKWSGDIIIANIQQAIYEVCRQSGLIKGSIPNTVVIGVSDINSGCNTVGIVPFNNKVGKKDIRRALQASTAMEISDGMAVLDAVVQEYKIDYQDGVTEDLTGIVHPLGMPGKRLEAWSHVLIARRDMLEVVTSACKLSGIIKHRITSSSLASAMALLSNDDMQQGACLLDIGGEYTYVIIYKSGQLVYTASMPWGGNYLTSCIALHLGVDKNDAEKLKMAFSERLATNPMDEQAMVIGALLAEKLGELCDLMDSELLKSEPNVKNDLKAGIVLTGGTSRLPGLHEIIANKFNLPVRSGVFQEPDCKENVPLEYASAAGLALYMSQTAKIWNEFKTT